MFSILGPSIESREQLYNLANLRANALSKISYQPYLYYLKKRTSPVRCLSARLGKQGRVITFEKLIFKYFIATMRINFLLKDKSIHSDFLYDFLYHSSFLLLKNFSTDAFIPDFVLFNKLVSVDPVFKASLFKYSKTSPQTRIRFLHPSKRIYVAFRWAASYIRMRNFSLKKSPSFLHAVQHIFFSELHSYSLMRLKHNTYRAFMVQEQNK